MAAELTEGETYTVKATTTNMSTKAGVPVAATLTVNIAAVVNSQIIMEDSEVYGFAAEETHTFEFSMAVPMGTGGKAGAVVAEVLDPNGNKLADGSLDVIIAAPIAFAYVSEIKRGYYSYSYDYFTVDVQNTGSVAGTCTLEFYTRVNQRVPFGWTDWVLRATVSHVLQPGEIRTFGDGQECLMRAYFRNNVLRMSVKFVGEPSEIVWEARAWA